MRDLRARLIALGGFRPERVRPIAEVATQLSPTRGRWLALLGASAILLAVGSRLAAASSTKPAATRSASAVAATPQPPSKPGRWVWAIWSATPTQPVCAPRRNASRTSLFQFVSPTLLADRTSSCTFD